MADEFKILPTRSGPAQGDSTERKLLDKAGGQDTIARVVRRNADGSTTTLKTRGGMPHFDTVVPESTESPCQEGLYYDGTITYTYDEFKPEEDRYAVTGGKVKRGPEATGGQKLQKKPTPILGDVFSVGKKVTLSGIKRRYCNLGAVKEAGAKSWKVKLADGSAKATITLAKNQPLARTDDVPLHQYSILLERGSTTQTVSGSVAGLVRSNLSNFATYGHLDNEPFNQHHAVLVDVSSDGTKMLIEIHERIFRSADPNMSLLASKNRERLSRPLSFVAAYELALTGALGGVSGEAAVLVYPRPYFRSGVTPSIGLPPACGFSLVDIVPPLPSVWWLYNPGVGAEQIWLRGVCYDKNDAVTPAYSKKINFGGNIGDPVRLGFHIGTQPIEVQDYAGASFYTDPSYDPEVELTWYWRYGNPVRLSNRCFGYVVAPRWLSNYVEASPFNQFWLYKVASPDDIATVNLELPVSFSERLYYDFYYRGIEGEIYPNIYGTARPRDGKVAAALHKTLCWI